MTDTDDDADDPVSVLRRWEDSGGIWRVARRAPGGLRIELVTCTGDEVVATLDSADPQVRDFVAGRDSSEMR